MNKSGQILEKNMLKMLYYAILIIFVGLYFSVVFALGVDRDVETYELEQHTMVYRLFDSPDCFWNDGILELDRFYSERMENCFNPPSGKKVGVEMTLFSFDGEEISHVESNKGMVAQKITCGLRDSKASCYSTRKYVLFSDNEILEKGILDILVVSEVE